VFRCMTHRIFTHCGVACALLAPVNPVAAQSAPVAFSAGAEPKVELALANVAIGALTGAAANLIRGESPWRGMAYGTVGGAVWLSGKLLAASEFGGSGFLGRQVASVGSSIVANVVTEHDPLSTISFPLYLVRVDVEFHKRRLRARVDVPSTVVAIYAAAQRELSVDWGRTVGAGALVILDQTEATTWAGRHAAGVIIIKDQAVPANSWVPVEMDRVLRHELVHLIQHDFTTLIVSRPVQDWMATLFPGARTVSSYVDLQLDFAAWAALNTLLSHDDRPWEWEARVLTRVNGGRIVDAHVQGAVNNKAWSQMHTESRTPAKRIINDEIAPPPRWPE
jgi:hypothetical protein